MAPFRRSGRGGCRDGDVAPPAGARSIGIGHPRSGDRCIANPPYPRRPRESTALFYPLDPDRASLAIESYWRERHPIGVVYIRRIAGDPGSSALRASTPGLCRKDPSGVLYRVAIGKCLYGQSEQKSMIPPGLRPPPAGSSGLFNERVRQTGVAPLAGARSIGIGHRFADDRCTATHPYPLDPLRVAEQTPPFRAEVGYLLKSRYIWDGITPHIEIKLVA